MRTTGYLSLHSLHCATLNGRNETGVRVVAERHVPRQRHRPADQLEPGHGVPAAGRRDDRRVRALRGRLRERHLGLQGAHRQVTNR